MHIIEISADCWLVSAHIQRNLPPSTWTAGKSIVNVPTDDSLCGNRLPASVLSTALNQDRKRNPCILDFQSQECDFQKIFSASSSHKKLHEPLKLCKLLEILSTSLLFSNITSPSCMFASQQHLMCQVITENKRMTTTLSVNSLQHISGIMLIRISVQHDTSPTRHWGVSLVIHWDYSVSY